MNSFPVGAGSVSGTPRAIRVRSTSVKYFWGCLQIMAQRIESRLLAKDVMAVAKQGVVGDWAAYIGAADSETNAMQIASLGEKLPRTVAEAIFPSWKSLEWRD